MALTYALWVGRSSFLTLGNKRHPNKHERKLIEWHEGFLLTKSFQISTVYSLEPLETFKGYTFQFDADFKFRGYVALVECSQKKKKISVTSEHE